MSRQQGGLLESLFGQQKQQGGWQQQQQQQQQGGWQQQDGGAGYAAQRARGRASAAALVAASAKWRAEVAALHTPGTPLREAMQAASAARRASNPKYQTLAEQHPLKGRSASSVRCAAGKPCPGAYDRPASPYRKRSHRVMSMAAARHALREFYRDALHSGRFNTPTGAARPQSAASRATGALRRDISRVRKDHVLPACKTRPVTYTVSRGKLAGKTVTRQVAVKSDECADSWLARRNPRFDVAGVDDGSMTVSRTNKKGVARRVGQKAAASVSAYGLNRLSVRRGTGARALAKARAPVA